VSRYEGLQHFILHGGGQRLSTCNGLGVYELLPFLRRDFCGIKIKSWNGIDPLHHDTLGAETLQSTRSQPYDDLDDDFNTLLTNENI
jgi:hypothetical protein